MIGREKDIELPPPDVLGPEISSLTSDSRKTCERRTYIGEVLLKLAPKELFANNSKARDLADKAVDFFDTNLLQFSNSEALTKEKFIFLPHLLQFSKF